MSFTYTNKPYLNLPSTSTTIQCSILGKESGGTRTYAGGYQETLFWKDSPRPKPKGMLGLNPTVYPKVYKLSHHFGKELKTTVTDFFNYHPYPVLAHYTHTQSDYYGVNSLTTNMAFKRLGYLDWPLETRLKIKDLSVNLGASLAEYRQTANMFRDVALGLFNMYRGIKKQTFKSLNKTLSHKPYVKIGKNGKPSATHFRKTFGPDDITDAYLMTRYGINPLMGDIASSLEKLRLRTLGEMYQKCYVSMKEKVSINEGGITGTVEHSVKVHCLVKLNVNGDFTVGNPLELAYELTPYSFVLDWMFNLGDILSSLDALKNVSDLVGTVSQKRSVNLKRASGTAYVNGTVTIPETLDYNEFQRSTFHAGNLPYGSFVPSYKPSTSLTNVVDGLALLAQIRRG